MLTLMNTYIINVNDLPFSVWPNIQVSIPQVILLYGLIIGLTGWLMYKNTRWLLTALSFFTALAVYKVINFIL